MTRHPTPSRRGGEDEKRGIAASFLIPTLGSGNPLRANDLVTDLDVLACSLAPHVVRQNMRHDVLGCIPDASSYKKHIPSRRMPKLACQLRLSPCPLSHSSAIARAHTTVAHMYTCLSLSLSLSSPAKLLLRGHHRPDMWYVDI